MTNQAILSRTVTAAEERRQSALILTMVTAGHAISHFLYQAFLVMLPTVKEALGIGPVEVGAIMTARQMAAGLSSLPGGVICDRLRRHWGVVLAACLAGFGLGWLVVGVSSSYAVLILGMILLSVAGSLWHLPAMAALSQRFADRRGMALSIHGSGGTIGDVIGPFMTGLLVARFAWRGVLDVYAMLPILLAIAVFLLFRQVRWLQDDRSATPTVRAMLTDVGALLRNGTLWKINLVAGLRDMCYQAFTTFLPLYLAEELGMGSEGVGLHLGLLFTMGLVASPAMGHLSDRMGRKAVLVPTMAGLAVLTLLLALYGRGLWLTVIIVALGLFVRSDYSLLSAMVLDAVGDGVATTTLGIMSFVRFVLGAVSPLIAGTLYARSGMSIVLHYSAALYAVGAILLVATHVPRSARTKARQS